MALATACVCTRLTAKCVLPNLLQVLTWEEPRLRMPASATRVPLDVGNVWTPAVDYYNAVSEVDLPATKVALIGPATPGGSSARLVLTARCVAGGITHPVHALSPHAGHCTSCCTCMCAHTL